MTLYLSVALREEIRRQAESAWPAECCGLLAGRPAGAGRLVEEAIRLENEEPDSPRTGYTIGPEALVRAECRLRERGLDILGFYHSHPDGPASPSRLDLERAWPGWFYVIVSVRGRTAGGVSAWLLAGDRSRFVAEEIAEEAP